MRRAVVLALALGMAVVCAAQEIKRPTADADNLGAGCGGAANASTAMANAYDPSGESTSSALSMGTKATSDQIKGRQFTTWQSAGGSYGALALKLVSTCTMNGSYGNGTCVAAYSTNSGSTWTNIFSSSGHAQRTDTVTLSPGQALGSLQVRACVRSVSSDGTHTFTSTLTVYDIRTEGTSGAARRRLITH